MVALSKPWDAKGTEATVGQRYVDPFAATPDANGNMSLADAVVLDGKDPTRATQAEVKPFMPLPLH